MDATSGGKLHSDSRRNTPEVSFSEAHLLAEPAAVEISLGGDSLGSYCALANTRGRGVNTADKC